MRKAAGSRLHSLRLTAEQLGPTCTSAESGSAAASLATSSSSSSNGSTRLVATLGICLARAPTAQVAGLQQRLVSTACRGGNAAAVAGPVAASSLGRPMGMAAAVLLAAGRAGKPAQQGLHTAARWRAAAPLRWQPLSSSLRQQAAQPRLRAGYGAYTAAQAPIAAAVSAGVALPAAAAAAVAAAARRSSRRAAKAAVAAAERRGLPSRWAEASRQLRDRAEWVLGRGYHAREAFINAVYMQVGFSCVNACGGHQLLLPLLVLGCMVQQASVHAQSWQNGAAPVTAGGSQTALRCWPVNVRCTACQLFATWSRPAALAVRSPPGPKACCWCWLSG